MYGDTFHVLDKWEIRSVSPDSRQVIIRHSWAFEWEDQPFAVGFIIETVSRHKQKSLLEQYKDWMIKKAWILAEELRKPVENDTDENSDETVEELLS